MSDSKTNKLSSVFKDNKEIIRLVIECVVLLGVFYYFNKKISKLSKHIEEISQKLELQDDLIEKQNLTITEMHLNTLESPSAKESYYPFSEESPPAKKKVVFETPPVQKATPSPPKVVAPKAKPKVQAPPTPTKEVPAPAPAPRPRPPAQVEMPDILRFLHMPSRTPDPPTQEIEILSGEEEDVVEVVEEVAEKENDEDALDKELESEMKDLD